MKKHLLNLALAAVTSVIALINPMAGSNAAGPRPVVPLYVGTWVGQVDQVGRETPFALVLTISPAGVTTNYPEQGCVGKLTRVGTSGTFVFYVEKITKGAYDARKGTGCLDGTITLAKASDKLLLSWFGADGSQSYQASAVLTRR